MKTNRQKLNNISGILAMLIIFGVAAACSFNTGTDTSDEKKDGDGKTTKKSALTGDEVTSMKKASTTSSKKSGATSENADEGDFIPVYSEISNENMSNLTSDSKTKK